MVVIKTQAISLGKLVIQIDACLFVIIIAVTQISILFRFIGVNSKAKLISLHTIIKNILASIVITCSQLKFPCVSRFFSDDIDDTAFALTISCRFGTFNNFNALYHAKGNGVPIYITSAHNTTHGLGNTIH